MTAGMRAPSFAFVLLALLLAEAAPVRAQDEQGTQASLCLMIESAARANGLPPEFLARVIWRESRFDPDAVGPVTRSGHRAQGIAQFMPYTAAERNLLDPFDPVQALPKAAEFLSELRAQFGNLGLAAAAYNAGPNRVRAFLDNGGFMPAETRAYVAAITGKTVEEWKDAKDGASPVPPADCATMMAMLRRNPNAFVVALEQRVSLGAAKAWGVQLAAGFSRERALASYARALKRYARVLEGHDPAIINALIRTRGPRPFYQVRVGADTRAEADGLCGKLRAIGGACLVLRNGRG
jgi:soluble lytic murein transglycosylase-like protein